MADRHVWELPHLRESHQIAGRGKFPTMPQIEYILILSDFYSVKFYPYTKPGLDPTFAVVGGDRILICRPPSNKLVSSKIDIIQDIEVEEPNNPIEHYTFAWSKDLTTGTPLLCVSGDYGKIRIFNAISGECLRVLSGHGGEINDLQSSPTNSYILASGSEDLTVRIWSLDPAHRENPCIAILEGDSHKEPILTLAFHNNGRYLLSGGIDQVINLWTIPDFPDENTGTNRPTRIFYPHFSSGQIHGEIIDCLAFHGDYILSKAVDEQSIIFWSITGFSSDVPPPPASAAPTTHDQTKYTRSAFSSSTTADTSSMYTRLLKFSIPDSEIMYTRFSLFPGNTQPVRTNADPAAEGAPTIPTSNHPILSYCNKASKVFFWDLSRLDNYQDTLFPLSSPTTKIEPSALATLFPSNSDAQTNDTLSTGGTSPPCPHHPFLRPSQRRVPRGGHSSALSRLHRYRETSPTNSTSSSRSKTRADSSPRRRSESLDPIAELSSLADNISGSGSFSKVDWQKTQMIWDGKYRLGKPAQGLEAHATEVVKGLQFVGRQVAWSADGRWCVVVGSSGVIAIFQRWR